MQYTPCEMTQRMKETFREYMASPVARASAYDSSKYYFLTTGDRWLSLGFLDGWLRHEDAVNTRRRRAYAEAEELYAARPVLTDHELLVGQPYFPEYTPEERERYQKLYEQFHMSGLGIRDRFPRVDHLSLDVGKLLRLGISGLIEEAESYRDALDLDNPKEYPGFEVLNKYDLYECVIIELKAVLDLETRYASALREKAGSAEEPRRSELLEMASVLDQVPAKPARTFREALQSAQFFFGTLFGLYPLNRPDQDFWPYYEKDLREGRITRELGQELIDNYCMSVVTRVFSRAACGFIVGGQDADGKLVENDLTYMFLTSLDHLRLPDPNGALAVNHKTSEDILRYSAQILSRGVTHPAFYNDEAIVQSLMKYGVCREDAVKYIHTTCAEISVVGKTRSHTTCAWVPLPQVLRETVGEFPESGTFSDLCCKYIANIRKYLKKEMFFYMERMLEASRNGYEPIRVCTLVEDCMARGRSIWEGGERYSFLQPVLIGFANAVDSLMAIRILVYENKEITLERFLEIVNADYAGEEAFRQKLIHGLPHYGNDQPDIDELAGWLAGEIRKMFAKRDMLGSSNMMPGTFSYVTHASYGGRDGASFDGRHARTSYSDGCSAVQGRDVQGPTAMVKSLSSWDQSDFLAGMVVNIKFNPEHLHEDKTENFLAVLKTFLERGGLEMQVNVVSRETLEDAVRHPEDHENLLVRIGGFSDYFVRLSPVLQNELIARTEY